MRDLMELSYEIAKSTKNTMEYEKLFVERFLAELMKEKSADIAPHFSYVFDVTKREYRVTLSFPVVLGGTYSDTCEKSRGHSNSPDLSGINEYLVKDLEKRTSQTAGSEPGGQYSGRGEKNK